MRIPNNIPKITGAYDKKNNIGRVDRTSSVASKKDVVSISSQAKDFQTVLKALKDIPDIRQGKVNELAEKYQSGNYSVNGSDIADKVLKTVFDKKA
jgi:negative regulator of flagellin synthesis FlgM